MSDVNATIAVKDGAVEIDYYGFEDIFLEVIDHAPGTGSAVESAAVVVIVTPKEARDIAARLTAAAAAWEADHG